MSWRGWRLRQFWDGFRNVLVAVAGSEAKSIVLAEKRLRLAPGHYEKGVPYEQLLPIAAAHGATIESSLGPSSSAIVEKFHPREGSKMKWLESALRKVEAELKAKDEDYQNFRGVRDQEEAHYHLTKRQEEIHDLNQKAFAALKSPEFIYSPGQPIHRVVSAWWTTDRARINEVRYQTKQRATAIRQRLDFTKRTEIRELKQKRKELQKEIEAERKAGKAHAKLVSEISEASLAGEMVLTLRKHKLVTGSLASLPDALASEVDDAAKGLAEALRNGLRLNVESVRSPWPSVTMPASVLLCDRDSLSSQMHETLKRLAQEPRHEEPDLSRFPRDAANSRAYLGLALNEDFELTRFPILYDLDALSRHVLVVGGTGSGKSVLARALVEGILLGGKPVLVIDPTGSWTGFAQACSIERMLSDYGKFGMRREWARPFPVQLLDSNSEDMIRSALEFKGISIVSVGELGPKEATDHVRALLRKLQDEVSKWPESKTRAALVVEEAHMFLSDKETNEAAQLLARTARVRGLGMIFISQNWTDVGDIRANCQTKIQLASGYGPDLTRISQVAGSKYRELVPKLRQGMAVLSYPEWGTTLLQARPLLHQPGAVSLEALEALKRSEELQSLASRLLARIEVSAGESQKALKLAASPRLATNATWRDVATRVHSEGGSASQAKEAIGKAGLRSPGTRTIQRFLRRARAPESPALG
jgi:hypothetical protein